MANNFFAHEFRFLTIYKDSIEYIDIIIISVAEQKRVFLFLLSPSSYIF